MDRQLLSKLYQEHVWHVQQRCHRLLGNPDEARDVTQDVFIKLFHAWDAMSDRDNILPWLYRVATNGCIDQLRRRKHHDSNAVDSVPSLSDLDAETSVKQAVRFLLRHFSSEDQLLAILRYVDECTLEEMEEISGLTRKTISKRLNNLRAQAHKLTKLDQRARGTLR